MTKTHYTLLARILIFLSILLFLQSYLFTNLLPAFTAVFLVFFLLYTKTSFKPSLKNITVTRTILEKPLFANHPINVKTTIKNTGKTLINISAAEHLPAQVALLRGSPTIHQLLYPGEQLTLNYQIMFTSRGRHLFTTIDVELSDPWKLYQWTTTIPLETTATVHSDPEEIKKARAVSTREHIEIAIPSLVGTEIIQEMDGVRPYIPGDLLKDIEWKATSRLQKLMTKLFQKKETIESFIFLDCSRSMRRTTKTTDSKLDHATNLAIHLTQILQSKRHPVGLIAYDEYKTLATIDPSYTNTTIFSTLTGLPGHISTTLQPTEPFNPVQLTTDITQEQQQFLSTIFPFLTRGKRNLKHPTQASGIYEAFRYLLMQNKIRHLIIITDMETNLSSLYTTIHFAHAKQYKIWLLTSFTPSYQLHKDQLTTEQLEQLYQQQHNRETLLVKFKKLHIDIVELTPTMQGGVIIEKLRRKTT